jgi:Protein of unknown function (DUF4235)
MEWSLDRGTRFIDRSAKDLQPFFAMKLIYKPFAIVLGVVAGIVGRQLFSFVWSKIDDEDPPRPNTEIAPWGKVLGAAAIQGAVFAATKAAVERSGAKGFAHITGVWPGERHPDAE